MDGIPRGQAIASASVLFFLNLTLTVEQQAAFVEEAPEIFLPIPGGWGRWDTRISGCRRSKQETRKAILT